MRYEYRDWTPILASPTGGVAALPPDLGARFDGSANGLQGEIFLFGSQGATTLDLVPLLAFKLLGLDVDPVFGVEGRGAGRLMFERGEANIDDQTTAAYINNVMPLVEQKLAVAILAGRVPLKGNVAAGLGLFLGGDNRFDPGGRIVADVNL